MTHTTLTSGSAKEPRTAAMDLEGMDLVLRIAEHLATPAALETLEPTLGGLGGPVLLHLRLHQVNARTCHEDALSSALDCLLDGADTLRTYDIETGIAGVGWLLEYVGRETETDFDLEDLHNALEHVFRHPWFGDVGRLRGLAGVGVWALCSQGANAGEVLASVVRELERTADYELDGRSWPRRINMSRSGLSFGTDDDAVDYSTADGSAGVVDVLAAAVEAGSMDDIAASLLDGTVPWLLRRCPVGTDSGLRWCDGELSTMASVLAAAEVLQQGDWHNTAADRVLAIIEGTEFGAGVVDGPSLRSGWAGTTRTLQRLARTLRSPAIEAAAAHSLSQLEAACRIALAGPTPPLGLLDGLSGAALVLLDAIGGETPTDWDRVLFTTRGTAGALAC